MIEEELRQSITAALGELGISEVEVPLEHPAELSHGDYATSVALSAAKKSGTNPRQLAEDIVAKLPSMPDVSHVEIAGPGFINFHLTRSFFSKSIDAIRAQDAKWGSNTTRRGEKIMVEYTSPNLFKPIHIGNLMSNIVGESVARLFEYTGGEVKRANYPSDIGLSVAKGIWGLKKTGGDPSDIYALGEAYRVGNEGYDTDEAVKKEIEIINKALYQDSDPALTMLRHEGIKTSLTHLHEMCRLLGTQFDFEFFESTAGPLGQKIVREHVGPVFEESDGAVIFRGERYGLHTRVFINSMGLPTYEAKDIGLIALKHEAYPFDLSVTTTAVEQKEYFKVLIQAAELVFPDLLGKIKHLPYGFLTLTTGKMSSRKGNVITGESLIEEMRQKARAKMEGRELGDATEEIADSVAVAAIKYVILKQSTGKNIVFDPEKSLSFDGDSGPYLQYAHTRAVSILGKARSEGVSGATEHIPEKVSVIERLLYRFPEVVAHAQEEYEPHYITTYLTELSSAFNSWYAEEKIVDSTDQYSPYKIALTDAFRQTMENGLWLLGIKAPSQM